MKGGAAELMGRKVFVVEDEALVSMLIRDTLGDIGCEVVGSASRFEEAIEKAKALSFDVAILDVNLAGQQTFPIAEELMGRGKPFVWSTGYGIASIPEALRKAPILPKPFQQLELERALRSALYSGA